MNKYEYQLGGSLPVDAPTYVIRQADKDLYKALKQGHYSYVLNSRQMGKSSLGVRIWKRLRDEGTACAFISLSKVGRGTTTPEQWYGGIIRSLANAFGLSEQFDLRLWWQERSLLSPGMRLSEFVEEILLKKIAQPIIIFFDEVDSVLGLPFCLDDFLSLIRYFYNQRAINPEFQRLTFVFLGVAPPSDLIQNQTQTPFNIGQRIELQGFQLEEVEPLFEGLQEKADNPKAVMEEILFWTGGQPFLTQKLCQLVSQVDSAIPDINTKNQIQELVYSQIINEWEDKDEPWHLRTLKQRILEDKKEKINLLEIYRQILGKEVILAKDVDSEILLKLKMSGLVVQQQGRVKVYNKIYQAIFNFEWIDYQLGKIRPYAQPMRDWFDSSCQDSSKLLRGKALQEALQWKKDKILSDRDHQYLSASKESEYHRNLRSILLIVVSFLLGTIASGFWVYKQVYEKYAFCPLEKGIVGEKIGDICFRTLITSGDKRAFLFGSNFHLNQGIKKFKKGKYERAIELFELAIDADPTDPVPQIYLNNAEARRKGKPLTLAVVAGVDFYEEAAKDILRGVADAQTKFNDNGGKNGRLLEIVIANDGNEEPVAKRVAEKLAVRENILGIIGHHASESSQAALPIYEHKQLAMVSPTSASSKLKSDVFFRTVKPTKLSAPIYARYVKNDLRLDKLIVFFEADSLYSNSFKEDFENAFTQLGGKVVTDIDLSNPELDINQKFQEITEQDFKVALLLPGVKTKSVAIAIARENYPLKPTQKLTQKLQLLSGLALSEKATLEKGGAAVEGLILASPCLAEKSDYMKQAADRWKQKISWRVATSYDATQAFIEAIHLSKEPTREEILNNLKSLKLPVDKTSGFGPLNWSESDRSNGNREYCLFEIRNHNFEKIRNHNFEREN